MNSRKTYKAIVAYDGTAYYGFQRQRVGQPTIQSKLEQALSRIVQENVTIVAAGRTDRGVHAQGQVVRFTVVWQAEAVILQRAINANLPDDIAILHCETCSPDFHPRFDAQRRRYVYRIFNSAVRHPLYRLNSWHVKKPLNVSDMQTAAQTLVGQHDFATFGQPPQGINTVREVFEAGWTVDGEFLLFRITANAFLQRMVRSIVGSLKAVGAGDWRVDDFVEALQACERSRSAAVAPPQGLSLVSVEY